MLPLALHAQPDSVVNRSVPTVDVSAQFEHQAAMPIQSVTATRIERLGVQNIADVLRHFAAVNIKDYGGIGGLKTVSVRNIGAAHTTVCYDGMVVSNCQAGPVDVGRFNLTNINELTIAVGQPNSLLQPAKAFASAATLYIESLDNSMDKPKTIAATTKVGSFGLCEANLFAACGVGGKTKLSGVANFMRADGNYPFRFENLSQVTTQKRHNSDIVSVNAELNLHIADSSLIKSNTKAYFFYSERGLPGSVVLYNNAANERLWDKNFFVQTDNKIQINNILTCRAQAKYNYAWNKYRDINVKYIGGKQVDLNTQKEFYLSTTLLLNTRLLLISMACDAAYNTLISNMKNNPQPRRTSLVSALNLRLPLPHLTTTATLVATHVAEQVENGVKPTNKDRLSPAFAINMHYGSVALRFMCKGTFRVPTFNELYYTTIGNTYLRPERASEFNFGSSIKVVNSNNLSINLRTDFYQNFVKDKIVAVPTTYVWKMHNCGKVDIKGAECVLSVAAQLANKLTLDAEACYTYQKAIDITDSKTKYYRHQIPYAPKHSGSWSMSVLANDVTIGYSAIAAGKQYVAKQNIKQNLLNRYVEHTASLSYDYKVCGNVLKIKFDVVNFTNCQYEIIKYYPMPRRSWKLTLNVIV